MDNFHVENSKFKSYAALASIAFEIHGSVKIIHFPELLKVRYEKYESDRLFTGLLLNKFNKYPTRRCAELVVMKFSRINLLQIIRSVTSHYSLMFEMTHALLFAVTVSSNLQ